MIPLKNEITNNYPKTIAIDKPYNTTRNAKTIPHFSKKALSSLNNINEGLMTVRGKLEQEQVPNYGAVEFLCRDVRASKGVVWVSSLRDGKDSPRNASKEAAPPTFWTQDISKWQQKLALANQLRLEEMKKIKNDYSLSLRNTQNCMESTILTRFSIVDPILLKGNTSTVFFTVINSMNMC
eukprot:TRINITY_DN2198_c0_g3_i2.p1 TRINITY_DN2198_c0_g3~~TRINITY_DN2198_c0_g3_i2.p1  ORF type:complete len:181 (-),score=50.52 TRINITY_DN2198_c0_g3_i2:538-1080(-)